MVTRFIGGRALTEEETWTRFLRYAGHWPTLGYGFWVIREKAWGRFIGEMGFHNLKREIAGNMRVVCGRVWQFPTVLHPTREDAGRQKLMRF